MVEIRPAETVGADVLLNRVRGAWAAESVIAHDEALFPAQLPGVVALEDGALIGHASYRVDAGRCELVSIEVSRPGEGVGSALLAAVVELARGAGCRTLWCTTTNDNLDALAFYQRRGFRLVALRPGAVDEARATRKPEIPRIGPNGLPLRDELDLELAL